MFAEPGKWDGIVFTKTKLSTPRAEFSVRTSLDASNELVETNLLYVWNAVSLTGQCIQRKEDRDKLRQRFKEESLWRLVANCKTATEGGWPR